MMIVVSQLTNSTMNNCNGLQLQITITTSLIDLVMKSNSIIATMHPMSNWWLYNIMCYKGHPMWILSSIISTCQHITESRQSEHFIVSKAYNALPNLALYTALKYMSWCSCHIKHAHINHGAHELHDQSM